MTTTTRAIAGTAAAAALVFGAYLFGTGRAQAATAAPRLADTTTTSAGSSGITVSAVGTSTGTPDSLRIDLAVSTSADTVEKALNEANAKAKLVQQSLRDSGVAEKDLQTTNLSIQPRYADGKSTPTIIGYQVDEGISAVLRKLDAAGKAISAAADAGGQATRINNIALDLQDTGPLLTSARDDAFAKAKAKAEQYAKAAGVSLGKVATISESVQQNPINYAMATPMVAGAMRDSAVPIQAGSQQVSITVTVTYTIA